MHWVAGIAPGHDRCFSDALFQVGVFRGPPATAAWPSAEKVRSRTPRPLSCGLTFARETADTAQMNLFRLKRRKFVVAMGKPATSGGRSCCVGTCAHTPNYFVRKIERRELKKRPLSIWSEQSRFIRADGHTVKGRFASGCISPSNQSCPSASASHTRSMRLKRL